MSEEQKEKIRKSNLGKKHNISPEGRDRLKKTWNRGGWNKGIPNTWYNPKGLELGHGWNKGGKASWMTGENNPRWVGGIAYWKEDGERRSSKSVFWRLAVKRRDGWKCYFKNKECSGQIEAHHILPWRDYPELRYDLRNGIALCHHHHPTRGNEDAFIDNFCGLVTTEGLDKV